MVVVFILVCITIDVYSTFEKLCMETSLAGLVETYATARWQTPKSLMRWLAICVVSNFKLCWLVNIRLTRWLAGSFVSWNYCLWQWRAGNFFPGELNINEDWRRSTLLVAAKLYEQISQIGRWVLLKQRMWKYKNVAS